MFIMLNQCSVGPSSALAAALGRFKLHSSHQRDPGPGPGPAARHHWHRCGPGTVPVTGTVTLRLGSPSQA
eukprot:2364388-Rhodomonas_salina.1